MKKFKLGAHSYFCLSEGTVQNLLKSLVFRGWLLVTVGEGGVGLVYYF